jgi:flagellar protein FliO/FliZ
VPAPAAAPAVTPPAAVAEPSAPEPAPKEELKFPIPDIELAKAEPTTPVPVEELNLGWTLIRTFVVLGLVIMAIYVTLNFGLRRLMGISAIPRGQAVVQVVERIPLDQKRAMFVVKAAGEYLLIGGGDGALQLITKLDSAEVERLQQQRPPAIALSPFLQKLLKRRDAPAPPAPGDHS